MHSCYIFVFAASIIEIYHTDVQCIIVHDNIIIYNNKLYYTTVCYITECTEVFDLFDFWDGRDGLVDAAKVGDFLRCLGLNPTEEQVLKSGGVSKMGKGGVTICILTDFY